MLSGEDNRPDGKFVRRTLASSRKKRRCPRVHSTTPQGARRLDRGHVHTGGIGHTHGPQQNIRMCWNCCCCLPSSRGKGKLKTRLLPVSVREITPGRWMADPGLPLSENSDKMDGEVDKERSLNRLRVPLRRRSNSGEAKADKGGEGDDDRGRANKNRGVLSEKKR